jgi:hypothetical protein
MLSRRVLRWSQGAAASAGAALGLTVSDGPKPVAHAAAGGSLARISYGQREAAISCAETEPGLAHFLPDQASPQVQQIAAKCRYYSPAFSPKDVPAFYDLSGITEDAAVFQRTVDLFVHRYQEQIERGCGPTVVVGYDARGFVLGPPVALALKVTSLQPAAAASTAQHSQPASQPVPAVLRREVCRWLPPPLPRTHPLETDPVRAAPQSGQESRAARGVLSIFEGVCGAPAGQDVCATGRSGGERPCPAHRRPHRHR